MKVVVIIFRKTIDTSSGGIDQKIVMRKHSTHTF